MKTSRTFIALVLCTCSASAFAQSTDVQITGRILPVACNLQLGNGGVIDLGDIRADSLNKNTLTLLKPVSVAMSIDCESEARYALQGTDNTESSTGTAYYGLGLTPADERIGGAQLTLGDITLDGGAAYRTSSTNSGETWSVSVPSTSINITRVNLLGYTNMQGVATGPAPIKALRGTLSVNAHIVPAKDLTLTEDVQIEGSATISLLYL